MDRGRNLRSFARRGSDGVDLGAATTRNRDVRAAGGGAGNAAVMLHPSCGWRQRRGRQRAGMPPSLYARLAEMSCASRDLECVLYRLCLRLCVRDWLKCHEIRDATIIYDTYVCMYDVCMYRLTDCRFSHILCKRTHSICDASEHILFRKLQMR